MKKAIVVLCLLCCSLSGFSQEITVDQLKKKVEQLENRVTILEKNIADQNTNKVKNANTITPEKQIWRKLSKGMNQDDVRKLLGEPLNIDSGIITHWYYSKSVSYCFVTFDNEDKVIGWREPE